MAFCFRNGVLSFLAAVSLVFPVSSYANLLHEGCSKATIQQGNQCYPPSRAFVEILQRSAYLIEPQTQHFLKSSPALMFHLLSPYYTVQRNGTSCSLASATMVLNAVLELRHMAGETPATQNEVLERVQDTLWGKATRDGGPGVTLEQYADFLRKMFEVYGVQNVSIEKIYVKDQSAASAQQLHGDLLALADDQKITTFLLLDFDEETFINVCVEYGHISPVGAYDVSTKKVLILDVDREWTGPYWLDENVVLRGMNTFDTTEGVKVPTYRGYLKVCLHDFEPE